MLIPIVNQNCRYNSFYTNLNQPALFIAKLSVFAYVNTLRGLLIILFFQETNLMNKMQGTNFSEQPQLFIKILTQSDCLLYFNNFGYTRHSSSNPSAGSGHRLGSALICTKFAQNLHKICSRRVFSVSHILLQILLHYPDSASKNFIVYEKR